MKGTRTNIDVGGVLHSGRELAVREALQLPDFASFRFPVPAVVTVVIRRVGRGLEVHGSSDVEAAGECARCLEEVWLPLHVEIDESFEPRNGRGDPLGENNVLYGDELDLQDLVRQLVDSALPYVVLCNENCPGLAAEDVKRRESAPEFGASPIKTE